MVLFHSEGVGIVPLNSMHSKCSEEKLFMRPTKQHEQKNNVNLKDYGVVLMSTLNV